MVTGVSGDGQVVVSWDAPDDDGGSAVTGYTVTSDPEAKTCTTSGDALTCTVVGLSNGTGYTFTVVATNEAGPSSPSVVSAAVTVAVAPVGALSATAAAVVTALAPSVSLVWEPPLTDGGFPIDR